MSRTECPHTRDLPQPFTQVGDLTTFRYPVYTSDGTFRNYGIAEVMYPTEAVTPSLRYVLDWYVGLGKCTPQDMQKMVRAAGVGNASANGFFQRLNSFHIESFNDFQKIETNRGSTSSLNHHLLFPGLSILGAGDVIAALPQAQAKRVTHAYLKQYFTGRNSLVHLALELYTRWLQESQFDSLQKLRNSIDRREQLPLVFSLRNGQTLEIPVYSEDDNVYVEAGESGAPGGVVGPFVHELKAQSRVVDRISTVYRALADCHRELTGEERPNEALDLTELSLRFLHDIGNGFRNLEMDIGHQTPPRPHDMRLRDNGEPFHHSSLLPHGQIQEAQLRMPARSGIKTAAYYPSFDTLQIPGLEFVRIYELGTCPLPLRALRELGSLRYEEEK